MSLPLPLECHACCKTFSGPVPAQQHFTSLEHKRKMDVMKQETTGLACHVCNVNCDTLKILKEHNQSPRHIANAEKQRQFKQFDNEITTDSLNFSEGYGGQSEAYKFNGISNRGWCYVCSIHLTSAAHAQSHINGKAHKKRTVNFEETKRTGLLTSQPGNITHQNASRPVSQNEVETGVVYTASSRTMPAVRQNVIKNITKVENDVSSSSLKCDICDVTFTGQSCALQHYSSEKHKKKANQCSSSNGSRSQFYCSLCKVPFTGPENEGVHMLSQKHLKNVKLLEKKERGEELPLSCNACGCCFTGQETAAAHFEGRKHKRNMENMNIKLEKSTIRSVQQVSSTSSFSALSGNGSTSLLIKPVAIHPEGQCISVHRDSAFKRIENEGPFAEAFPLTQNSREESTHSRELGQRSRDTLLIKPDQQNEFNIFNRNSLGDSLLLKSEVNDEERLHLKQDESANLPCLENRIVDDASLDIKSIETDTSDLRSFQEELKVKAEISTGFDQSFGSISMNSDDLSSRDIEPVRYIRNDLYSSLPTVGRGRGIFSMVIHEEDRLPGKVVNSDRATQDELVKLEKSDSSETQTTTKSVWEGTGAAPQPQMSTPYGQFENIGIYNDTQHTEPVHVDDTYTGGGLNRHVQADCYGRNKMEEYYFDELTGRGRCYICDIIFTSSKHKTQHILGKNHLKAREVRKQILTGIDKDGDHTQWYPCNICNCRMNTIEQLRIHEQSPKHLKELEKQKTGDTLLTQDRTLWFPCRICNCNMNSEEQLRVHEASPAHISKLQKYQHITQKGLTTISPVSESGAVPKGDIVTPLQSFLSEELFPQKFLPAVSDREIDRLNKDVEEKLVMTDEPFYIPCNFAQGGTCQTDTKPRELSGVAGGTKRGQGSDLAWATRNKGTRVNDGKTPHSPSLDRRDSQADLNPMASSYPAINNASSKTDLTAKNPYAATHPYYCHTCKSPMNTKESYESHLKGKRHMQKVCTEPAPPRNHHLPYRLPYDHLPFTHSTPRNYQLELYKKAMEDDTLCFLPTGTGKTLVAVMTISTMLKKCPSKNVLFLVDKVLLVLQQSKCIRKEIGDKEYERVYPDSDTCMEIEKRTPLIASVCMDQQSTHGTPLWKHDIVVVTAAFCKNLLDKKILRWEDFSLVVFDEAHHCEKGHPFNSILTNYHRPTAIQNKPKILGLTASPAGKADVPKTLLMLHELVANMGGVRMTIVEEHENLDTLNEFQSNAEIIIRTQLDPDDSLDQRLKHELNVYIMYCMVKLYKISNINFYVDFKVQNDFMKNECDVRNVADEFVSNNLEMIQSSLNLIDNDDVSSINKVDFSFFCLHVQSVCMALSCLEEGGAYVALQELEDMETTTNNFEFAGGLGMPTANLHQMLSRKSELGGQSSTARTDNAAKEVHFKRIIDELTEGRSSGFDADIHSISLVLVKERGTAHLLTRVLQNSERMRRLDLETTCVVGHGGSGAGDKGMNINQQKRVLEDIKQYKYQVIVATSVAEEGVDWPDCKRVISMYPPSSVTALVQMRGRARRKNSKFVVLCSNEEEEGKLYDIMKREENMINATRILLEQYRYMET